MGEFEERTICILGRQPGLGLAELESLYGAKHVKPLSSAAMLDIAAEDINFKRLGGTIKVARVLNILPHSDWPKLINYLVQKIPEHLQYLPSGSFTLGLSVYNLKVNPGAINKAMLGIKKLVKATGRPIRVVPNKQNELNSAQVLHNKLTHKGAWELIFFGDGQKTYLAQTLFIQDIEAYGARDQARPARDARVGMLPPKLAQIIINLSYAQVEEKEEKRKEKVKSQQELTPYSLLPASAKGRRLLDPFCGTGVILQEALLMGYEAIGTDIDARLVEYSKTNLDWLKERYGNLPAFEVFKADATNASWLDFGSVASEVYLGRPLNFLPSESDLKQISNDVNTITKKFLQNLQPQLKKDSQICLAVPAWRLPGGKFKHLPVLDHLTDVGYNYLDLKHTPREKLFYFRENQVVARQLIRLKKA